jgi:hypothetical protein
MNSTMRFDQYSPEYSKLSTATVDESGTPTTYETHIQQTQRFAQQLSHVKVYT